MYVLEQGPLAVERTADGARFVAKQSARLRLKTAEELRAEGYSAGLDAAAEAVRAAGHTPFGVYDECECPEDVREQDGHGIELEDFYGCEKSRLYDVCRFCCSENDYHTEACATGHHHGPDKPYCTAVAAIDALRGDSC